LTTVAERTQETTPAQVRTNLSQVGPQCDSRSAEADVRELALVRRACAARRSRRQRPGLEPRFREEPLGLPLSTGKTAGPPWVGCDDVEKWITQKLVPRRQCLFCDVSSERTNLDLAHERRQAGNCLDGRRRRTARRCRGGASCRSCNWERPHRHDRSSSRVNTCVIPPMGTFLLLLGPTVARADQQRICAYSRLNLPRYESPANVRWGECRRMAASYGCQTLSSVSRPWDHFVHQTRGGSVPAAISSSHRRRRTSSPGRSTAGLSPAAAQGSGGTGTRPAGATGIAGAHGRARRSTAPLSATSGPPGLPGTPPRVPRPAPSPPQHRREPRPAGPTASPGLSRTPR
jgi:hypothetical protein